MNTTEQIITIVCNQPRKWLDWKQEEMPAPEPLKKARLLVTTPDASIRMYQQAKEYVIFYNLQTITEKKYSEICIRFAECLQHKMAYEEFSS